MNPQGPVLRDILLPHASWWPPALGWWLVAAAVVLVCIGLFLLRARWRARRPLRAALHELDAMAAAGDAARFTENASQLLRRVAQRIDPAAASSTGDTWRRFVHRYARTAATRDVLDDLLARRFQPQPEVDVATVVPALRVWCRAALGSRKRVRATDADARSVEAHA